MSVVTPPRPTQNEDDRDLAQRVVDPEALIEEARRRARHRRRGYAAVVLLAVLAALAASFADGGRGTGSPRTAGSPAPQAAANVRQLGHWSVPSGPQSRADTIVVDPDNSGNVYAAAGGRVFRSSDGGQTWVGGSQIDERVDALAIDPQRPSTLYAGAGAGVFKSVDAGRSWVASGLGLKPRKPGGMRGEGNVFSLVVDPADGNVIYAVSGITGGRVSKSIDAGRTWRTLLASPTQTAALTIDPASPQILFAAAARSRRDGSRSVQVGTIAMTSDGGESWHTVLRRDTSFYAVASDPASPGTVYALGPSSVLVTADGGSTWRSAGAPPAPDLVSLALDPRDPKTLYVSAWKNGLYRTADGGRTWAPLGGDLGTPITVDPQSPSTIYAGETDGIAKTLDGGKTWRPADSGIIASDVLSIATDPRDARVVYAATDGGLVRSGDRGRTWETLEPGIDVEAVAIDPADSARVLAGGTDGILISTNRGRTWATAAGSTAGHRRNRGWGRIGAIVFDPHHPRTVFAAEWGAGLIESTDGGASWHTTMHRPAWISSIAIDPLGSGTVYSTMNGALLRSDRGSAWNWRFFHGIGAVTGVLAIDPSDPQTLYAVFGDASSRLDASHLAKSTDGGANWKYLRSGAHYISATAVTIDPREPSTIYAATQFQGVLRTTDGGTTWRPFDSGLVARAISTLALDRTGSTLYAGTDGAGIVRIRLR